MERRLLNHSARSVGGSSRRVDDQKEAQMKLPKGRSLILIPRTLHMKKRIMLFIGWKTLFSIEEKDCRTIC